MSPDLTNPENWWKEYCQDYAERSWRDYRYLLSEYVRHAAGAPLLDVGCGYGFLVECARQFGIQATGLESSRIAIERCKIMHPLADVRAWSGGENLPMPSESIGGAILNEFIDHIGIEENRLLFRELSRVLRPGGSLIVRSPSRYNKFDKDKGHITFFSMREFRAFVESFQFVVLEQPYVVQPLLGTSRLAMLTMRIAQKLLNKPQAWEARIDLVARKGK